MLTESLLIAIVPLLIVAAFVASNRAKGKRAQQLADTGIEGRARMLRVDDTGMTVNDNPRVRMEFQVLIDGVPPYSVVQTSVVSRVKIPQAGLTYQAFVDPDDPQRVVVQLGTVLTDVAPAPAAAAPTRDPIAKLEVLADLHRDGALTDAEFAQQKQRLLSET
jgi:hypothetical protein